MEGVKNRNVEKEMNVS